MTTLRVREIKKNLCKKGFKESEGDHTFLRFYDGDKKSPIYTKISHGEIEIGDSLIGKMSRQLRLTKKEFVDFATCTLSEEEYYNKINHYL